MKSILNKSLYLAVFIFAGIIFQISCSNDDANSSNTVDTTEQVVFVKKNFSNGLQSIWITNIDGSNQSQIPITLPSGIEFYRYYGTADHTTAKISKDGLTVLFTVQKNATAETFVYSCNVDGTNIQEVAACGIGMGVYF